MPYEYENSEETLQKEGDIEVAKELKQLRDILEDFVATRPFINKMIVLGYTLTASIKDEDAGRQIALLITEDTNMKNPTKKQKEQAQLDKEAQVFKCLVCEKEEVMWNGEAWECESCGFVHGGLNEPE